MDYNSVTTTINTPMSNYNIIELMKAINQIKAKCQVPFQKTPAKEMTKSTTNQLKPTKPAVQKKASTNEIAEELEEVMELMDCDPDEFQDAVNDLVSQDGGGTAQLGKMAT